MWLIALEHVRQSRMRWARTATMPREALAAVS